MAIRNLFRDNWLRWLLAMTLAIVLAIALMLDYSISSQRGFFLHLALAALVPVLIFAVPRLRPLRRFVLNLLMFLPAAILLVIAHANITASYASRGLIYSDVSRLPPTRVGLVFGTTDRISGRENLYFRYRIDAAQKVWEAGKVEILIVSGDNRSHYYNEPQRMREALIERGIPANRIVRDFAGLRTLDSVVRSKEIFGVDTILFISQRFQIERAIYLAKAHGLKAYGYEARDVESAAGLKTRLREVGARVKMWLDVNFLHTRPRHLGKKEILPE